VQVGVLSPASPSLTRLFGKSMGQLLGAVLVVCVGRGHHRAPGRRGHVGAVERGHLDGGVRPGLHPLHARLRPG